jgi:PAS domain S-box-containing protein/putative nucleotidyltransferase with HDIG domain
MADSNEEKELRILMLEDAPSDAELEQRALMEAGLVFAALRVDTREAFERALDEFRPHIVLADFHLPAYDGREALEYARRTHPQIPVIMTTGTLGDEAAVELLKLGAKDYVLKDRLARLTPAVRRALSEERGIRNRKLAEGKYKAVFNEAMDGIVLIDAETSQAVECNTEFEQQTGRTLAQLKEIKIWEILPTEQREPARQALLEIQKTGAGRGSDFKMQRPNGEIIPIEFSARFLDIQQQSFIQSITRDIGERLRAEEALRDSEARYKRITEGLTDYQYTVRIESGQAVETTQSQACVTVTGYTAEEFAANPYLWIQMVVPEDRERVLARVRKVLAGEDVPPMEHRIIRKDGELRWVYCTIILFRDASGKLLSYDGVIKDITERKQAEQAIKDAKAFADSLIQSLPDIFYLIDQQGGLLQWNKKGPELLGIPPEEMPGQNVLNFICEKDRPLIIRKIQEALVTGSAETEARLNLSKGLRHYMLTATRVETKHGLNVIGIGVDITERKQAEQALQRANHSLKTLSAANLALVRAATEEELLRSITNIVVEIGGHLHAAVGYAEHDPEQSITPIAWTGMNEGHFWVQHPVWSDTERGQIPIAMAIRSGTTQICHDIASAAVFKPWKDAALARGYVSNIVLPLSDGKQTFGGLSIYSSQADAFDEEETRLLEELSSDLAYGIMTLRTRAEHEQHATILRRSLEQSIQTIAATVEARDPYTAGHQERVSELATAIAREMGLPENQVNGVHLAAIIHDLGKIHIPAEILSKPGRLNDIEYMLIKTHPQSGYDILKDVTFPWPIADIILQHHERLDGSGYPHGLTGEQILFESKILAVADVVEAMSSHRPYRPGLGILAALSEIERGRGSMYDPTAVDACLKLVTEKGFRFSSKSSIS